MERSPYSHVTLNYEYKAQYLSLVTWTSPCMDFTKENKEIERASKIYMEMGYLGIVKHVCFVKILL